jgi:uncharacterized membrane protein YagU involved in acid resistance
MTAHGKEERRSAWKGGVVAGLIGGAVMAVFMMIMNAAKGMDVWMGAKMPGMPFLGQTAMEPGFAFGPVMIGMLSHFLVSIVWAVPFALLVYGFSRAATVGAGALWGIVVWLGMFYIVLPILGLGQIPKSMPVGLAVIEHVLFGVGTAVGFLPFQRRIETRRPTVQPA